MDKKRCKWCNLKNPLYIEYHDTEWCVPNFDDKYLYEMLILESFQAGLSWECVLNKRESFRNAYDNFDIDKVICYDETKINELLNNKGIIRNRLKINASIKNSRIFKEIVSEYGSFYNYLKVFTKGETIYETDKTTNALSDAVSKDLQARGMTFVGSVIIYSYLQAIGVICSHDKDCFINILGRNAEMISFKSQKIPYLPFPEGAAGSAFTCEKLVDIKKYFNGSVQVEPVYYNEGYNGAIDTCFVRETVAKKLQKAIELLPEGLAFRVYDAWRPVCVQEDLYNSFFEQISKEHPSWDDEKIEQETIKFASKPSYDMNNPAVHNTGGAIDLTIVHKASGEPLDMGTEFDEISLMSNTAFFEDSDNEEVKRNRRLLYWVMIEAGFTNLPTEWWHYDYGDRFWSYYKKSPSLYGGIEKP